MNIIDYIPDGINNAISLNDLAVILQADTRTVRQMVHNARKNGAVICSTCDNDNGGYYIPRDVAEAVPYYKQQLSRINSATAALQSVIDFIGTPDGK